jgi:hypothetical protein
MSEKQSSDVLGALPRTRPHRRSQKRAAPVSAKPPAAGEARATSGTRPETRTGPTRPETRTGSPRPETPPGPTRPVTRIGPVTQPQAAKASRLAQPAQPGGVPKVARTPNVAPATDSDIVGTAVRAAAELAEIGLSAGARAVKGAVSRLPRP